MAEANPAGRRRTPGLLLRETHAASGLAIAASGIAVKDAAGRLLHPATKISPTATWARRASPGNVRDLGQIHEAGRPETAQLMGLARQARQPGPGTQQDYLRQLTPFVGLGRESLLTMIALTTPMVIVQLSGISALSPWPLRNQCTLASQIMGMN